MCSLYYSTFYTTLLCLLSNLPQPGIYTYLSTEALKSTEERTVSLLINSGSKEQNEDIVSGTLAQDNGLLVTLLHN